ncbi:copper amine oxidase N-terminal domain-containing protein [Paenibacillus rhizophilus]|uniref:Copper amine oxidase N-terminal domain-containing protein n=1 Tax=Paenibacillus rhizophilus TaxID=1850366 RepID=A0A3N9PDB0_9BACL|nr:copper amine oxidase N-terminal domain-containing protein [Paenibacillus rhizophilus]RQW13595.1 copper amine oxidase N-terminal domain-containing protein [Paenibacillus rhizophilus]
MVRTQRKIGILLLVFLTVVAIAPSALFAAPKPVAKEMPISIGNYYVLFPGELAPYVKSGKWMVPIRAFCEVIGADMSYNPKARSVSVSLLGEKVQGIKAGQLAAVFEGDLAWSLGAAPELRNGVLFVPAAPILNALKVYRSEIISGNTGKSTLAIKAKEDVLLRRIVPAPSADSFPSETTFHPYPFYPETLSQEKKGKEYLVTLNVQNTSGFVISKDSTELELTFVDEKGNAVVRKINGTSAQVPKAGQVSFKFTVPQKADYILFRARIVKSQ